MTRSMQFSAVACLAFETLFPPSIHAQSPEFEVASIKPSPDVARMIVFGPELRNGSMHGENVTVRMLLAAAYGMTRPRIIGPDWLDKNRFDIIAKSPKGVPDSDLKPMLQMLLKDRFKLVAHLETKEMAVYVLTVAKGGVKMPVYPAPDTGPKHPGDDPGSRGFPMIRGTVYTSQLAQMMAGFLNRPVIDNTGLTERYNFFLSFAPLSPQADGHSSEFGPPDIFTAVKEQLGLTLQSGRDNVEVVVVDHIEKMPTEN